jgi:hypothetical protein
MEGPGRTGELTREPKGLFAGLSMLATSGYPGQDPSLPVEAYDQSSRARPRSITP